MPSSDGFLEVPCAKCGRKGFKIQWGDLCPLCREQKSARANRVGRWWALGATVLVGAWVYVQVPGDVPLARIYGIVAVVATYLIVWRIVYRLAMEVLK